MDLEAGTLRTERDWTAPGVASLAGLVTLDRHGGFMDALGRGEVVAVADVREDPRAGDPTAYEAASARSLVNVPVLEGGRLVALLFVNDARPRAWSAEDVALARDVAEQTRTAVERARSTAALRASEARYRALFDSIEAGFCVVEVDADGSRGGAPGRVDHRVVEANPAFYTQTGLPDAILGRWLREAAPALEEHWYETYARVALTGEPLRFERGSEHLGRWFDVYAFRVGEPSEARVAILLNDISTRRVMEERLRESEERFRNMADHAPVMMWVTDPDGACTYLNRAWFAFTGQSPLEARGLGWLEATHPDHRSEARRVFLEANARREAFQLEYRLRRADGTYRWAIDAAAPRFGAGGEFLGYVGSVTNIHERKAAQEALEARVAEEVAERAKAEEALRQSQKMEAMGSLTGGVAHDFNNLLTPIVAVLDWLERQGLGSERDRRLVAGAAQSGERARILVQRLLAFARRQPLQPRAVDLTELVTGMAELVASTTGPQIKVAVEVSANLPPAKADPNQLKMAILNLAVNARDAMPEGGTLRISATAAIPGAGLRPGLAPSDRYVCLSVADTGHGMDEATLARAVEPFFSTKGVGRGTGLGLSMVDGLASQLGGALKLHSRPGLGTQVTLWLPESHEAPTAAAATSLAPAPLPRPRGTALLVDDEEAVRLTTADILGELGYEVTEAVSAEAALALVQGGMTPGVLLTDHLMPGMSGSELARALRATHPGLPVLILSGYAASEGLATDLPRLTKPFRKDDLAAALAALEGPSAAWAIGRA